MTTDSSTPPPPGARRRGRSTDDGTPYRIAIADIDVEVRPKQIKNLHIGVYPPDGHVRVSAPMRLDADAVRLALVTRVPWIRRRRAEFRNQPRQTERLYVSGESHYYLGRRYRLEVITSGVTDCAPAADVPAGAAEVSETAAKRPKKTRSRTNDASIHGDTIRLTAPPHADQSVRERIVLRWYREQLTEVVESLRGRWEAAIGVAADEVRIRKMKTLWGSCNPTARRVWLNLELAKKPTRCIEYVIAHELIHLLERHHNDRFRRLMDRFMPDWRVRRDELNAAPLAHEEWGY